MRRPERVPPGAQGQPCGWAAAPRAHLERGPRGGCGWQARRAQEGATAEEPWSQGGERQVWSGELVQHPSCPPSRHLC